MNRLIHGDSVAVLKGLPDACVDLVCTDPPYGNDAPYGRGGRTILGDANPLVGLLALSETYRLLRRNRCCVFFLDAKHLPFIDLFVRRYTRFCVREYVVWDKRIMGMGSAFRKQHELVVVLEKGKPAYNSRAIPNVLGCPRAVARQEHPHQKPVPLIQTLIAHTTKPGDVVLDPFLGSGTTALAAVALGRRYIGIERDKRYVQLARSRIAAAEIPRGGTAP